MRKVEKFTSLTSVIQNICKGICETFELLVNVVNDVKSV